MTLIGNIIVMLSLERKYYPPFLVWNENLWSKLYCLSLNNPSYKNVFCSLIFGSSVFCFSLIFLWISSSSTSDSQVLVLITLAWSASLCSVTSSNTPISLQIFIICVLYPLFTGLWIVLVETCHNYCTDLLCPSNSGIFTDVFSFYLLTWNHIGIKAPHPFCAFLCHHTSWFLLFIARLQITTIN